MALPCAGVPEPAGRPLPSGAIEMSQVAASASLIGLPNFGWSAAVAVVAAKTAAVRANRNSPLTRRANRAAGAARRAALSRKGRGETFLNINMGDGSVGGDAPAGNLVHMVHREGVHV